MRIWVTGGNGMLGKRVVAAAQAAGHEVLGTTQWQCPIDDLGIVMRVAHEFDPDAIINCAGALPDAPTLEMIAANTVGPHNLAYLGRRLIHMSTDCVYSGRGVEHNVWLEPGRHPPAPDTLYGRTKLAGEPSGKHVLVVRGSFIGPEHGLLRWLMDSRGQSVDLWAEVWWNGSAAAEMAKALVDLAARQQTGVLNVAATQRITKAALVQLLDAKLGLGLKTTMVGEPRLSRVLYPQYEIPSISTALPELVREVKESEVAV
jgi:dTDP-4-dehydrorhamnose reductase